jgi:hypothetical protein
MTPARIAANRVRAWKHGGRARMVTWRAVLRAKFDKILPGGAAIVDAYRAEADGEFGALDLLHTQAMAESELLRRQMVGEVRKRGVLVEEALIDKEGNLVGTRVKANPALEPLRHFNEQLGHTADQLQITPKSRGQGDRAAAQAAAFRAERDAQLRQLDRPNRRRLPPPPASED